MKTPSMKNPREFYVKLAERAYEAGRAVARKTNGGYAYDRAWELTPPSARKGLTAMTKFIAKVLRKKP